MGRIAPLYPVPDNHSIICGAISILTITMGTQNVTNILKEILMILSNSDLLFCANNELILGITTPVKAEKRPKIIV